MRLGKGKENGSPIELHRPAGFAQPRADPGLGRYFPPLPLEKIPAKMLITMPMITEL